MFLPPVNYQSFYFLHSSFLPFSQIIFLILTCIFWWHTYRHFFLCLYAIYVSSFYWGLCLVFDPFLIKFFVFLWVFSWVLTVFVYFGWQFFKNHMWLFIFSLSVASLFSLFYRAKVFNFNEVQLIKNLFCGSYFWFYI